MVGRLIPRPCRLLTIALSLAGISPAFAQRDGSLPDPTQPPASSVEPATPSSDNAPPPSGLQTIILGKGRKPMAVINGVTVQLGDKVGEATLVKLTESEAVLQGPAGREVLNLLPGLVKRTESPKLKREEGKSYDK